MSTLHALPNVRRLALRGLAALALWSLAGLSFAQAFVYLNIPGVGFRMPTDPRAPAAEAGSIPVLGVSLTGEDNFDPITAGGAGTGKVILSALRVVKAADRTSASFFRQLALGQHLDGAVINYYRSGTAGPVLYQKITLTHVFVVGLDWGGNAQVSGGVRETIGLAYETIRVESGLDATPTSVTYDLRALTVQ